MIKPGSIRESHLSQQFELKHSKLQKADEGAQLLIAEDNPDAADHLKFKPITIHGDGTLDGSGRLTVNFPETSASVVSGDGLTDEQKQKLDSIEEGATRDKTGAEVKASYEQNSDTNAFTDANKNQLDSTNASYLGSTANHVAGSATTTTVGTQTTTTQFFPNKKITEVVSGTDGTGANPQQQFSVTHNFGYIPQYEIYKVDGSDVIPIEAEVVSTNSLTTVKFTQTIGTIPAENVTRPDIKLILA